ncbi:type II toxin-antitoxin system ParD family antitoxin [Methylobacterium brachiatum]|uniref:Type II toxin-antitoxin system ParD family antitoxin n=1 Tax=Methylobacterium brachiatum TaxID=269660 RepID=A0ABV1RA48_9HYPH
MAARRSITVSITPEQDDLIQSCLQSGRFASTSEVVRAALRLLDQDEGQRRPAASKAAGTASSSPSQNR